MITQYVIKRADGSEYATVNSSEEADYCVSMLREQDPHSEYTIESILKSNVKDGFGRDPDLH